MNFLIKKGDYCGPCHGVLFTTVEKVNPGPKGGRLDIITDQANLTEILASDRWDAVFEKAAPGSARRYLALSLDWGREGDQSQDTWSTFARSALTQNTIDGRKLAEDVDVYILASITDHPKIFEQFDPATTVMIDYSELSLEDALVYFEDKVRETLQVDQKYVPSWKRGESDEPCLKI